MNFWHLSQVGWELAHLDCSIVIAELVQHFLRVHRRFKHVRAVGIWQILALIVLDSSVVNRLSVDSIRSLTLKLVKVGDWLAI